MIQHSVKFKRVFTNATLVDQDPGSLSGATVPAVSDPTLPTPEQLLGKIASAVERIDQKDSNRDVVGLAIALSRIIVEKLVGSSAELQEQRLYQIIQETQLGVETTVGIHLNPSNLKFISAQLKTQPKGSEVNLIADESIEQGECRVEFRDYDLISNIEHQLDQIENHIAELNDE